MQGRARRRYNNRDLRLQFRDFVLQLDRLEEVCPALDQGADHVTSSGVSSPLPMAARMSPNASAHSLELDSGRVLKLTGTPLRTGTARLTRRDSAAVSFSLVPASNRAVKMSGSFSAC